MKHSTVLCKYRMTNPFPMLIEPNTAFASSRAVFQSTDWILYPCVPEGQRAQRLIQRAMTHQTNQTVKCGGVQCSNRVINSPDVLLHCLFSYRKRYILSVAVVPDCLLPADHNVPPPVLKWVSQTKHQSVHPPVNAFVGLVRHSAF